jgi:DNA-binding SARP family transcriptional activator
MPSVGDRGVRVWSAAASGGGSRPGHRGSHEIVRLVAGVICSDNGAVTEIVGRLRFGVLGPLEARRDGVLVRLGGERQRALLAVLLVHANELVRVEVLVEALLGEQRAESAVNAVRVGVSRLRRVLESGDGDLVVETRPGGYVLAVESGQLDAEVFEQLLTEGRGLLTAGDAVSAGARLREALCLWRGAAYADVARLDYVQSEIRRLEELRLVAVMDRVDADLALGATDELVVELEPLVALNPLQERLRAQLMQALYRAGRQSDALAVYREISGLSRELGLEPGRALKELERSILQQDAALDPVAIGSATPGGLNLPVSATPFAGRVRELADVTALLSRSDARLLTLTGAGGNRENTAGAQGRAGVGPGLPRWGVVRRVRGYHRPGAHRTDDLPGTQARRAA